MIRKNSRMNMVMIFIIFLMMWLLVVDVFEIIYIISFIKNWIYKELICEKIFLLYIICDIFCLLMKNIYFRFYREVILYLLLV